MNVFVNFDWAMVGDKGVARPQADIERGLTGEAYRGSPNLKYFRIPSVDELDLLITKMSV